ncbi:uncharacterized protein LOC116349185 [Contarinia nasturtii]|uniref:uncharacterized protein LOC116349185 n=1 Tax=Contarinia nasturtii TaxID=265458 RepID=UPI0012D3F540|nr:uncharacterized protein LOC116349185 [Contarinia nasturtii]
MMKFGLIIVGVQFVLIQGISCFPASKSPALDWKQLTVVVSANENNAPIASLVKPKRIPRINAIAGKAKTYRVPLEITVNSHLIRRITAVNRKYRLCSKKSNVRNWRNLKQSPPCITILNLSVPIELEVPINVESIVEEIAQSIEPDIDDYVPYKSAKQTFDGPEKVFARTEDDYYRSQTPIGDPIRAKRTKRTEQSDFFRDTDSLIRRIAQALWRRDTK